MRGLRTWLEIDRSALRRNVGTFRRLIGRKRLLMAVVKSNAYGHGLMDAAQEFERLGVDWFGVDSVVEGIALRKSGIKKPILVLGYTLPERFRDLARYDLIASVSSFEALASLESASRVRAHLKIDSGMHRQGFQESDFERLAAYLNKHPALARRIDGIFTHFAEAKNPAFPASTKRQISCFDIAVSIVQRVVPHALVRHAAASSGTICFPESHYDMVRVGIALYGLWPSRELEEAFKDRIRLHPALTWKSIVSEVKRVPRGAKFGYDLTEGLPNGGTVAIVPVGYWHGYPRALSSIGRTIIKGKEAKVLGRVSMDMVILDLAKVPRARVGDEVVLLGGAGSKRIAAEQLAELSGTSNYEFVTRINPLIHRAYNP